MIQNKKTAFTMIELVFVIVVLGILAAMALPRLERDTRQAAADNILSAIRYTQHMALLDNVTDPTNANWQKAFWRFGFQKCNDTGVFYYIGSDKNTEGNIDGGEEAVDPLNGLSMMGSNGANCASSLAAQNNASPNIFITNKYGISNANIAWGGSCMGAARYIGFDYLGRPHRGYTASATPDYASVLTTDCTVTLTFDGGEAPVTIVIEKGTGHAYIQGQNDS